MSKGAELSRGNYVVPNFLLPRLQRRRSGLTQVLVKPGCQVPKHIYTSAFQHKLSSLGGPCPLTLVSGRRTPESLGPSDAAWEKGGGGSVLFLVATSLSAATFFTMSPRQQSGQCRNVSICYRENGIQGRPKPMKTPHRDPRDDTISTRRRGSLTPIQFQRLR